MLLKDYKQNLVKIKKGNGITKYFQNLNEYPFLQETVENVLKPRNNRILKEVLNEADPNYKYNPLLIMGESQKEEWQVQYITEPFSEDEYRPLNALGNNFFRAGTIIYIPKMDYLEEAEDKPANPNGYRNIKDYYKFYKAIHNKADGNLDELCYYAISETTRIMLNNYVLETYGWQSDLYKQVGSKLKQEKRNQVINPNVSFDEYTQRLDTVIKAIDNYLEYTSTKDEENKFGL